MRTLVDGMFLYHGSFTEVSAIDLSVCRHGKDFGQGFYLTSSYKQARNFVPLSVNKQVNIGNLPPEHTCGYISIFRLHLSSDVAVHYFHSADKEWLHFVAANRRKNLFPAVLHNYLKYDIIGGKIANDHTARTLQLYTSGGYGIPGSREADDIAIRTLLPNRLEDQFCFSTKKALQSLEFVRSEKYDISTPAF